MNGTCGHCGVYLEEEKKNLKKIVYTRMYCKCILKKIKKKKKKKKKMKYIIYNIHMAYICRNEMNAQGWGYMFLLRKNW